MAPAGTAPEEEKAGEDRRSPKKRGRHSAGGDGDDLPTTVTEKGSARGTKGVLDAGVVDVDGDRDGTGGADASGGGDGKRGRKRRRREHVKDEETGPTAADSAEGEEGRHGVGVDGGKGDERGHGGRSAGDNGGNVGGDVAALDEIGANAESKGAGWKGAGDKKRGRKRGRTGVRDSGDDATGAEDGPGVAATASGSAGVRRGSRVKKSIAYLGDSAGDDDDKVWFNLSPRQGYRNATAAAVCLLAKKPRNLCCGTIPSRQPTACRGSSRGYY